MKKRLLLLVILVLSLMTVAEAGIFDFMKKKKKEDLNSMTIFNLKPEIDPALKKYAADYEKEYGIKITVKSVGGGADYSGQLKSEFQSGKEPDIFVIQGENDFLNWEHKIEDLSNEKWAKDTDYAFKKDNKTYGYPYSIEGYGIIYNKDLLKKAGIDPKTLNNFAAYKKDFEKIDSMKEKLGIESVISMAAGPMMTWLTGSQNFNAYLSNGIKYNDMTYVNNTLKGIVDKDRLSEYADWIELLFNYSDSKVLNTGNYDEQVNFFKNKKSVFIAQGNWIVPNLKGVDFEMGIAPMGSQKKVTDGIFVAAPSFYAVNKDSKAKQLAKDFLERMVSTDRGVQFIIKDAQMVPAFKTIKAKFDSRLNNDLIYWIQKGNNYNWNHYYMPDGFCNNTLGSIYSQLANKQISKTQFIEMITKSIKTLESE
jgi:raffinose/stachyose/melibiose transport system substrate-binding protein